LSAQDFLWIGWTLLTLAYAYWWFFLHTYMFIRHLLPLLAMSAGVLFYQLLSFTYHRRSRFPGWAFAILIFLLCAKELSRSPGFYEDISSPEYSTRFSVLCRSTPAWQADDLAMRALCSGPLPHP
jgi:hypothetical protein